MCLSKIEKLAKDYAIDLTYNVEVVKEGWLGKPKGLLQVLWERGWINESKLGEYYLKGTRNLKDKEGEILLQHGALSSVPSCMAKHFYRSCALDKRNTKERFNKVVRDVIEYVRIKMLKNMQQDVNST